MRQFINIVTAQSLNEGVVKVPPAMLQMVLRLIATNMFWMLRDKPEMKTKYPEHYAAVLKETKVWGVKLPREKFRIPERKLMLFKRALDFSGLPDNYTKLVPDRETMIIALDYGALGGDDGVASYRNRTTKDGDKEAVLVIHMLKIRGVAEFPSRRKPEEVPYIMANLTEVIRHELQHLVQHVLLAPIDRSQIATRPDYREHGHGYYASQVEFDTQLADAVDHFIEFWKMLNSPGVRGIPTLAKAIKQYVGLIPSATMNGFSTGELFKALRKLDPEKYKVAVRKFLPLVMAGLKTGRVVEDASEPEDQEWQEAVANEDWKEAISLSDTREQIIAILQAADAQEIKFRRAPEMTPVYLVGDDLIEWDGKDQFATFQSKNDWLYTIDVTDYFPHYEEDFNREFWEHPYKLYHATIPEKLDGIMAKGLLAKDETRGLNNRGVGAAVFTTSNWNEAQSGSYGSMILSINTKYMATDGYRPYVSQEPPVVEEELRRSLAHLIGFDEFDGEIGHDYSDDTVIIDGEIPPKYLTVVGEADDDHS